MYYVYEWFDKKTNKVFYVGKGCRLRYKVRKHNKLFNEYLKNNDCDTRIIKYFENEEDAFAYEYERVCELKAKGECECNINKAGNGGSTKWWTPELREYYSKHNVMKSQKQRERMSKNNPMKNHEVALKMGRTIGKAVIINGVEYPTIREACEAYNTCGDAINYWCKRGRNARGDICRFKGQPQVEYDGKRYNKGGCRAITYNGKHYETPKDIAKEFGIKADKVYRWAKNGFDDDGNFCRYDDDTRILEFKKKTGQRRPIIVNGFRYGSVTQASRELNVSTTYLRLVLKSKVKSKKYICKYDNQ